MEYFAAELADVDLEILGWDQGSSAWQQIWVALAILCSLMQWSTYWMRGRVRLEVRLENVSGLTLLTTMSV